jgi:hypothetical protein
MIVEADDEHAVIWTKPEDWQFDPNDPAKGLGRFFQGSFQAAWCDCAVSYFTWPKEPKDITRLRALFTRDGHEPVER